LPIRTTVFEDADSATIVDAGIRSFLADLPHVSPAIFSELGSVSVEFREPEIALSSYITRTSSIHAPPLFRCAKVTAVASFNPRSDDQGEDALPMTMVECADAAYYLGRALDIALDFSELASPGCVWAVEGPVVVDGKICSQTSEKAFFNALHPRAEFPTEWPPVQSIPLTRVITWAKRIGVLDGTLAETRLQRAVAAYTNLVALQARYEDEALFRAMQALEAFYCDGTGDLRRQISEKSKLWLGGGGATTNVVGQLYDLRSKYIHGSAKLRYRHEITDPWEQDEKAMRSLSLGASFATRLVVGTLQRCINQDVADLSWAFEVRTS